MLSHFEEQTKMLEKCLTRLQHDTRPPRLAMEADGPVNTKNCERTEGAATAVQAMHGDSCTAQKVQDGPKTSISFGVKAEPPHLPCREDVLVEDGAAAPKSCLPSLEMRTTTAASGLVTTGKTSTATETTSNEPLLRLYSAEETNFKKSPNPYASYDSSVFKKSNLPAAPHCRRAVETKPRQNRTFDSGSSQGHFHACPFWGIVARVGLWLGYACWSSWSRAAAFFRRRFAGSLKQSQPRIRCAGKKSCRRGRLEAT